MPELIAPAWRAMTADDLDAVVAIAVIGFPDHFEGRPVFENRLALYPQGCFVLVDGAEVQGYLVAYPWRLDAAPALNSLIAAIAAGADVLYLHDLALHPRARSGGHSHAIVERIAAEARAGGWPRVALVAVNDATAFWARHGFAPRDTPSMSEKLASYGPDARYMVRIV